MLLRAVALIAALLVSPAWAAATLFPTILVDSATGSDTAASGAGPTTAITGAACVTDGAGTVVTIDGSPDLSGVAVDGTAVIFLADTAAGARNFGRITAADNTAKTVTVDTAFAAADTDACAIGGKRASIGGTTSIKLFSNNSAAGDALPGWIVEMQSGHTETLSAAYILRRAGNQTDGLIELRGTLGAATKPILTFSNNGAAIQAPTGIGFLRIANFELRNSNATKTASVAMSLGTGTDIIMDSMVISHASNNFWKGLLTGGANQVLTGSDIRNTANISIDLQSSGATIFGNYLRDAGTHAIAMASGTSNTSIQGNVIYSPATDGINIPATISVTRNRIVQNTIDSAGSDAIDIANDLEAREGLILINNILSNSGAYGINFNGATQAALIGAGAVILNNAFYGNTTNPTDITGFTGTGATSGTDPAYTAAANDNFAIGSGLASKGYPLGGSAFVGGSSATYSYVDPGAAQRVPSGGGTAASFYIGQ